jgi:uncharacterized protein YceK
MRNTIFILAVLLMGSGCVTQKRCMKKFPPQVGIDTVIIEKHDTLVEYNDTTIYLELPGEVVFDTVYISKPVPVPIKYQADTAQVETKLAKAKAWMEYKPDRIILELEQKDTTILFRLDSALVASQYWHRKYTEIKETQVFDKTKIPWYYRAGFYWMLLSLTAILLIILLRKIRI